MNNYILKIDNLLSKEYCEQIINSFKSKLKKDELNTARNYEYFDIYKDNDYFHLLDNCFNKMFKEYLKLYTEIQFTENKNQWNTNITHRAQLDGGALFIEKSGKLTYHLYDKDNYRARHLGKIISPNLKFHAYTIDFIGSNISPTVVSKDMTEDYANFFIGKQSSSWATNVRQYKTVTVDNLYNHIDAIYCGGSQSIKYNFIVFN